MAASAEGWAQRTALAGLLVALGLLTLTLGAVSLKTLASSYREQDLALTETPESFRAWLAGIGPGTGREDTARRVAARLLVMPLPKRRAVAIAVTEKSFWSPLAAPGSTARAYQLPVRAGLMEALASSPAAGDLYLAAAWLDMTLDGFGDRPRRLLRASQLFAPREVPLLVRRLALAPLVWPLAEAGDRALFGSDLAMLRNVQPARAEKIAAALATSGVTFP